MNELSKKPQGNEANTLLAPVFIPSFSEYKEAKKIVIAYENEQDRLEKIRLEEFRTELSMFFKNNDKLIINDFELRKECNRYEIIPTNPQLEEMYEGQLNDEIEKLCQKHSIKASIIYWCYHK